MKQVSSLYETTRFLLLDTQKQLQALTDYLDQGDAELIEKSLGRIDYIENHHLNLINRASLLKCEKPFTPGDKINVLAYEHLSFSLKTLSHQMQEMAFELQELSSLKLIQKKMVFSALQDLSHGLDLVIPAIETDTLSLPIDICKLQLRIQKACDKQLDKYRVKLKTGQQTNALLQASFIVKGISAMGSALLRVGEGIISANMGQFIQIDRYHTLEATLSKLEFELDADLDSHNLNIHPMGETKSGCTISGLRSSRESESEILAIFKEGDKQKMQEEKAGIESWHKKFPGIAPEVYSYQKSGDKAALLYEYLTGHTFNKLLVEANRKQLKRALKALFVTLENIWRTTVIEDSKSAKFMQQLKKRLHNIYEVHPDFNQKGLAIGEVKQASLEKLVEEAEKLEQQLFVPRSVYIHGDFNTDNILYDELEEQISFVDLHRSDYLDYVQDLSVLMVSFYRLNHFEPKVRKMIGLAMEAIYQFGQNYAESENDPDYETRMALGLARSFLTSTRFVIDQEHAKNMHNKGRFLLEQLLQCRKKEIQTYQLPKEIFHD